MMYLTAAPLYPEQDSFNTSSDNQGQGRGEDEDPDLFAVVGSYTGSERDARGSVSLYVVMAYLSFLSLAGAAGNALVLVVFSRKRDTLVSTLFIIVLAVVDFVTCLVIIPCTVFMEYVDFHIENDELCKFYQFLITSSIPFSAMIMVAIAVDRYLCICHPFLRLMTLPRAKLLIAALGLFAVGLGICVALMYTVYEIQEPLPALSSNSSSPPSSSSIPYSADMYSIDDIAPGFAELVTSYGVTPNPVTQKMIEWWKVASDWVANEEGGAKHEHARGAIRQVGGAIFEDGFHWRARRSENNRPTILQDPASNIEAAATSHEDRNHVSLSPAHQNSSHTPLDSVISEGIIANVGLCQQKSMLISDSFQFYYQKLYTAMYPVCLVVVVILYVLIYRSVLQRRTRRLQAQSKSLALVQSTQEGVITRGAAGGQGTGSMGNRLSVFGGGGALLVQAAAQKKGVPASIADRKYSRVDGDEYEEMSMMYATGMVGEGGGVEGEGVSTCVNGRFNVKDGIRKVSRGGLEKHRMANLKTAAMLFVVTVVFVITFLPAFLMALELVPYNIVIFYLYFANNVANPVIYSFMNQKFRADLRRLFVRHSLRHRPPPPVLVLAGGEGNCSKHGARTRIDS